MEERKVIFLGTSKKGTHFTIRYPKSSDAPLLTEYINEISKEKTFVTFQGEELSLEDETNWLNSELEKIQNKKAVQLVVEVESKIVGVSGINMREKIESHVGVFGITIAKDFRNEGIGKIIMEQVINESQNQIPQLRIITLGVFANNLLAKNLYESLGFKEFGILPKGIIHRGEYVDHIYMYKKISS